ncbi:chymotrypsin-like protease CTRL-1 [Photinus pyralis]|uniref:chymotrypsin-like protease CTRL-1 n=1 Tax=Photinus pyralis TaxID=7054 RepID=UPI001266F231|nr:chymotrypsin-like protease CTRL-1 [Photinus pyralis]
MKKLLVLVAVFISPIYAVPIVNGFSKPTEPNLGAFPFHASLMQLLNDNKTYHSFCGGSLIHPMWILTAAHCIQIDAREAAMKPSQVHVALGSIFRSANGAQVVRVSLLTIHPAYLKTGKSDIGLVKLVSAAKLSKNVNLVRLHINNSEKLVGKTAFLTGFGIIDDLYNTPERLRKATLHVSSYKDCFNDKEDDNLEICATSTIREGKACKVSISTIASIGTAKTTSCGLQKGN